MHLVFATLGLIVGAAFGYWLGDNFGAQGRAFEEKVAELESQVIETPPLSEKEYTFFSYKKEAGNAHVFLRFPLFGAPAIDEQIAGYIRERTDTFVEEMQDVEVFPPHTAHTYAGDVEYVYENDKYLSVVWLSHINTGGAHGNIGVLSLLFSKQSQQALSLDEIFTNTDEALQAIAEHARREFAHLSDYVGFAEGLAPTQVNYQNIALSEFGLVFYFPPYQVGPYAAGTQTLYVPWNVVEGLLKIERG